MSENGVVIQLRHRWIATQGYTNVSGIKFGCCYLWFLITFLNLLVSYITMIFLSWEHIRACPNGGSDKLWTQSSETRRERDVEGAARRLAAAAALERTGRQAGTARGGEQRCLCAIPFSAFSATSSTQLSMAVFCTHFMPMVKKDRWLNPLVWWNTMILIFFDHFLAQFPDLWLHSPKLCMTKIWCN